MTMTNRSPVAIHCFVLLAFALAAGWPSPSPAQTTVQASFDCSKAQRPVDRLICSEAALRWQDVAMARSYTAASASVTGSARDALLTEQRAWLSERDQQCVGKHRFAELTGSTRSAAHACLLQHYRQRRQALQHRIGVVSANAITEINLEPLVAALPELVDDGNIVVTSAIPAPDGSMVALLLPSLELDGPDQVWLYRVTDGALRAVTPAPRRSDATTPPKCTASTIPAATWRAQAKFGTLPATPCWPASLRAVAWQNGTLYTQVALWNTDGSGEENTSVVFASSMTSSRVLSWDHLPAGVYALLDAHPVTSPDLDSDTSPLPESQRDAAGLVAESARFQVWNADWGRGTLTLAMRQRAPTSPMQLIAWGSWELSHFLLDGGQSQLIYAGETGLMLFDLTTRSERRIAGTSSSDWPMTFTQHGARGVLVWKTHGRCGETGTTATASDIPPDRLCIAQLAVPGTTP